MNSSAPRLDCTGTTPAVGYHHFHDDLSLNFQCNRWVQWIGPSAMAEVTELAGRCDIYPEWIDGFLGLADAARDTDRRVGFGVLRPCRGVLHAPRRSAPRGRQDPVRADDAHAVRRRPR